MMATNALGEMLGTLFERRLSRRNATDKRDIVDQCLTLLSETSEASGRQRAASILDRYQTLDPDQKTRFFAFLNDQLDLDAPAIAALATDYAADPSVENFRALNKATEPRRQGFFRKLNEAPGATAEIVRLRRDLLAQLKTTPALARTDQDLVHLLRSWFNRGFLVLRQITWDSPASVLEKIIAYEAVHQIQTWDDLRRRLHPADRRCFGFFHPAMPDEPLIFVEVALTKGVPNSIQSVLSEDREILDDSDVDTAVFYSISNCQEGLAGISFGNSLIKQVARDLSLDLPNVKRFVTLSPIPGLRAWLRGQHPGDQIDDPDQLARQAARYLTKAKTPRGQPLDPVARFHLGNGAKIHAIHADADTSENGRAQSGGVMVNYSYDLTRVSANAAQFAKTGAVGATPAVRTLAKQAANATDD